MSPNFSPIRVGMKVTNGPCVGYVSNIKESIATVVNAKCNEVYFNYIHESIYNLKEVK